MAHEIGHYVLNHIYESILFFGVILVGGFAFVRWCFDEGPARWGGRWGVSGIGDVAGLPLLVAVLSIYFFVMTPILNTYIRVNESEADIYGLHAAGEPDGVRRGGAQAGRVPQAGARADRGVALLRPPERPGAHRDGDELEGREPGARGVLDPIDGVHCDPGPRVPSGGLRAGGFRTTRSVGLGGFPGWWQAAPSFLD